MNRRSFLTLAAGASLASGVVSGEFISTPAGSTGAVDAASFELSEITIADLQTAMDNGALTARSLTERYLQRIQAIDKQGPALNAFIELNPDALEMAEALDCERVQRGRRGLLHGIPIVIKDNIDTADRMHTTAGSLALEHSIAPRDSFVVQRLRAAGCVLLGKSNMSEWANFRSVHSTSGWSGRGGLTRNPYALDRNASGSSSGSAVAVAANLCAAAVGTETDGSIVSPASICGIVGLKPTVGLLSRSGIIPLSRSQDAAGPMARCVADVAALLGAMTGADERDLATVRNHEHAFTDYTRVLDRAGLNAARIGVVRDVLHLDRFCQTILDDAIACMRESGATIIDPVTVVAANALDAPEFDLVLQYEFKTGLNAYLADTAPRSPVTSLEALIEFNERNATREMPFFGQDLLLRAQQQSPLSHAEYARMRTRKRRLAGAEGIDVALTQHRLDAIITITSGPAWLTDLITGDHDTQIMSQPPAVAGYPHITVPAGFVHGLPVGLSFFAGAFSEPRLIRLAYAFEQTAGVRRAPRYLATAPL